MKIGALIVTTGLPRVSGVTALLLPVGAISAGQRMISVFQCAGVDLVGLVVGAEDKKSERQLAQNTVIFLRCPEETDFFQGLQKGLSFMMGRFDRVFILPGDIPLVLPKTLETLLKSNANIVQPESRHVNGYPILLDKPAMQLIVSQPTKEAAEQAAVRQGLRFESVQVEDSGIFLRGEDMSHKQELIEQQSNQLSRPIAEVAICNGSPLYDSRLAMLLHLVEDTHSVQDACSLMQISYSTAWKMLNHVEDELGFPLVVRNRGGASGNGTLLTEKGKAFMNAYDRFSAHLNQEAKRLYTQLFNTSIEN